MVNTYLLYDETGECIIIDPGCSDENEQNKVSEFISGYKLTLKRNINTHCHIDHVLGHGYIESAYHILPEYHKAGEGFITALPQIAGDFGYTIEHVPAAKGYFDDGDVITFGKSELKVLYTPGHADGSVCFYQPDQGFVITGDVLFLESIGRTDLVTGHYDVLMKSIREKLFTLPDDVVVYPGHGPETTIGHEKRYNPFIL